MRQNNLAWLSLISRVEHEYLPKKKRIQLDSIINLNVLMFLETNIFVLSVNLAGVDKH